MIANAALRKVFLASLLRRRLATALSLFAIALGVALGLAVQLIHTAALDEFGRGIRQLAGEADLQALGPREGFDDALYATLAQRPEVAEASPVLEVEARLPGREDTLTIYGIDVFRVARVVPSLMPAADAEGGGEGRFSALRPERLFLSAAARSEFGLTSGDELRVQSGLQEGVLMVAGGVPGAASGQVFGVMDIGAAQQLFDRIGRLTRVDLRLAPGTDVAAAQGRMAELLPPGVELMTPVAVSTQAAGLSQAYRVNLSMLAAIALLTGGFLVFSTQLLSVVRRRQEFAFLRALGLERSALLRGLLAEGALIGLAGGAVGVGLGYLLTGFAFATMGGDLGAGYFRGVQPEIAFRPLASTAYLGLGIAAGIIGAWVPAREAVRMAPARALRGGDESALFRTGSRWRLALAGLVLAGLLCLLPPIGGVPVAGYAAVALILASAVMSLPGAVKGLAAMLRGSRLLLPRLAHARLFAAPGQGTVAGAGVVVSVALAVSMAIMVSSFRSSVDDWLGRVLPADLYLRASASVASGYLDAEAVARVAQLPGIASVAPVRYDSVRFSQLHYPMTLIARPAQDGRALPLVSEWREREGRPEPPAWVSEAMADLLDVAPGDVLALPISGTAHRFRIAGIWRDYARQHGAVVVELDDYRRLSGDERTNDLGIHLAQGADAERVTQALADLFGEQRIEITRPEEIRATSLAIFDRTFFVTYLMEAVAVLIGLFGVATTFAALAISRRKEFGVLRHLGLERHRIGRLLALEGAMTAAVGVGVGAAAGGAVAFVLIEVINRQSFHWSMDMDFPFVLLTLFAVAMVALAAISARLAGAGAMRRSAVLAVREDW